MSLRCLTLLFCAILKCAKKPLAVFLLLAAWPLCAQNTSADTDLKKQADQLFVEENYAQAYKLYSQLVANYPKDPVYNYKLGVCMIYAEPDKKKSLAYLKFAVAHQQGNKELKDAQFYLGKAYHINYLFDEAVKQYNEYKLTASSAQQKKLQVDREIRACFNGKRLLSNLSDLEILSKSELSENDYFRNYKKIGGKLLVKPDEFKTGADKKKKEKSVIFLPSGSNVVYFSSYGDDPQNGKDIYTVFRQPGGSYSKPEKVKGINTEFDEDYPFLHPDGKTLYFASKGHNSMGGYDIFKSVFQEETNSWSSPVNLEFPINSPDDDFLFVTDSLETVAYFSTGRQSPPGKIDVLKIKTSRRPIDLIAMQGHVIQGSPEHSLQSSITVKDVFTHRELGSFSAAEDGSYQMELPNGGKLLFTVETPGLETQSVQVSLPVASAAKPFRQTISYEKGKLKILNYFDEPVNDNTYLQYLKVIEKKARLDVSEPREEAPPVAVSTTQPVVTKSAEPATKTETPATAVPDPKKGMDNKQLARMARQEAEELKQEAAQLRRDYVAASEAGARQKVAADKKAAEASDEMFRAETLTDEAARKTATEAARELKDEAAGEQALAERLLRLAASLEQDTKNKEKEAELTGEYVRELEKSTQPKNSQSSQRLDQLQKQIGELSARPAESERLMAEMRTEMEGKEKQISEVEQTAGAIRANLEEIRTAISEKEAELSKTRKKSAKKEIAFEIEDLQLEEKDKIRQIAIKEEELKRLSDELAGSRGQIDAVNKIISEDLSPEAAGTPPPPLTLKGVQDKYLGLIGVSDPDNRSQLEGSTVQLNQFNQELDAVVAKNKAALNTTKNKTTRLQLSNEIKQAESRKKQNQQLIAANDKKLKEIQELAASRTASVKKTFDPISAATGTEAVEKLNQLSQQLNTSDTENFDYEGYQNPAAQSLKVEADARINDAAARQKKLKEEIAASRQEIQEAGHTGASVQQLNKEAEDLMSGAREKREQARAKSGTEKDKLIREAVALEGQANQKFLEAAEVTRSNNDAMISTNRENILSLIQENKSAEAELNLARALSEEAWSAYRKAADIRAEGHSLENTGGKLGSFSNAEEKEEEAMIKQRQALEILLKDNPGFQVRKPEMATSVAGGDRPAELSEKLQAVNAGLQDLAAIRIESYQKLYEANDLEISQSLSGINEQQAALNNTPTLKTEYISANRKKERALELKQSADISTNPNEQLSHLAEAIKTQNEVLKQLNTLAGSLKAVEPAADTRPSPAVAETSSPAPVTPAKPVAPPSSEVPATQAPVDELSLLSQIDVDKPDPVIVPSKDTNTSQGTSYFDQNVPVLFNTQAGSTVRNSLSQLKETEAQVAEIDHSLARLESGEQAVPDIRELNARAETLNTEGEELNNRALELRNQALQKEGEAREALLAQVRELEEQARDKMIGAADYKKQANEAEFRTNSHFIGELISRLKADDPDRAEELSVRREDYQPLKNQISNLRAEADALNNKAAKLGAISNAEEKEQELIQKQNALLAELKAIYPDFEETPVVALDPAEQEAGLRQKKSRLREKQYSELTSLTNAFSLEYESSKNNVPSRLSQAQRSVRDRAESLNQESKRLLIRASQEKSENEKVKLLNMAARSGGEAVEKLNSLVSAPPKASTDLDELARLGTISSDRDGEQYVLVSPSTQAQESPKSAVKVEGLEIVRGNAYSTFNPIPVDARMESGLIFRVQIGAFKTRLPNNAFKGLSPLNGETTGSGYIRYTAGNFNKLENANAVKNDLRNLGYSDAFVVAYYNGRRITLTEALEYLSKDGITPDPAAPQSAGITADVNVPRPVPPAEIQESVTVSKELDQTKGLLYTIQIGVYTRQITKPQILELRPVFREQLTNGLFRYTAGIYNNPERLLADKARVVDMGIRDAFVSAYLNGKRIPFSEAKERQSSGDPDLTMEAEDPIVFPVRQEPPASPAPAPAFDNPLEQLKNTSVLVEPFKNEVESYPAPTPDNGVKSSEEGLCFKVQIGAFSKEVPEEVATRFSAIRTWPIDHKQINGLYIYNIGNFSELRFARALKEEAAALGITDAFIAVYRDGRKLYGAESEPYLR